MSKRIDIASRHVSVVVHAEPSAVYDFAHDVVNLPKWASGLAAGPIRRVDDRLIMTSPMGEVTVRFTEQNKLGILDHDVTLPSGTTVNNPVRVLAHPEGAEVVFTVRQIELTEDEFDRDVSLVLKDLRKLRDLVESSTPIA
ncbi:MAG: SRPBCC family protein [Microbacterium enclense]